MWRLYNVLSRNIFKTRCLTEHSRYCSNTFHPGSAELDIDYYCDEANLADIANNIQHRKSRADINNVLCLSKQIKELLMQGGSAEKSVQGLQEELQAEIYKIPNRTHCKVLEYTDDEPHTVKISGKSKKQFTFEPRTFAELAEKLDLIRTEHLGLLTGYRSYYLRGQLADLEQALIRFTIKKLLQRNFLLISVPDLISPEVIESCGMATMGKRTQVFKTVSPWKDDYCLAGTAEMPLCGLYSKRTFKRSELPLRMCATSRCYRAETSPTQVENYGIFRVREFTKVEMLGITSNESGQESEQMLSDFVAIQEELFTEVGLCYQVLDMPPHELGSSAHRKYDIEAWMPGKDAYGEISSASNCTDYQSRRLHIKYENEHSELKHVHTVNGTACAVPRMLIALFENFQNPDGSVTVPDALRSYMDGKTTITIENPVLKMKRSSY